MFFSMWFFFFGWILVFRKILVKKVFYKGSFKLGLFKGLFILFDGYECFIYKYVCVFCRCLGFIKLEEII